MFLSCYSLLSLPIPLLTFGCPLLSPKACPNRLTKIHMLFSHRPDLTCQRYYPSSRVLLYAGSNNNESNKITKRCRLHRNPLWLVVYLGTRRLLGRRKTNEDRSFKAGQVNGSSWKSHAQTMQTFLKDFMFRQTLRTCILLPPLTLALTQQWTLYQNVFSLLWHLMLTEFEDCILFTGQNTYIRVINIIV